MPVSLDQILDTTRGALPALTARADAVSREARATPRPSMVSQTFSLGGSMVIEYCSDCMIYTPFK